MSKSRRTSDLVNSLLVNPDNSVNIHEGTQSPYFLLDTTATPTLQPGMFGWDDAYGTADLRLKGNNVTLQLGQEILARVVNKTGADLLESDYKVVRVRVASEGGAQGQRLAVVLAQGNNDPDSVTTLGIVTENIANNEEGFITILGNVNDINTTGTLQGETWVDGDVLFLSPTTPGGLTKIKPQAPQHTVVMGYVVYAHANHGKIFVKVDNGYELDELHNVLITNPQQDQVLKYDATSQVWVNSAGGGGTTPTLAQVTTAGNTTSNHINVGTLGINTTPIGSDAFAGNSVFSIVAPTGARERLIYAKVADSSSYFTVFNTTSSSGQFLPMFAGYHGNGQDRTGLIFHAAVPEEGSKPALSFRASSNDYSTALINRPLFIFGGGEAGNTAKMMIWPDGTVAMGNNVGQVESANTKPGVKLYVEGNVGIGTTTDAGYKLDVAGTARIQNNLYVNGPSTFTGRIYLGDSGADTDTNYYIQSGGQVYIQANAFRANNFYTDLVLMSGTTSVSQIQIRGNDDSSGFIRFTVNNTEAARFFNNGDLAIGTTSDDGYKLNVNGVIAATGGTSTNWNTAYSWGNHATAGYLTSQPWVTSGSNIYYNTGNVGIGTTTPAGKLDVYTTGLFGYDKFVVTTTSLWGDNANQYVTIGAGGASGIMIANPHIVWNAGNSAAAIRLGRSGGVAGGAFYEIGTGANDSFFIAKNALGSGTQFYINSLGNVGIGTSSPGYKLDVIGNSRVQSLRVETNYPLIEIRNTTGPAVVGYVTTRQALIGGSFGNGELTLSSQGSAMPFYVSSTNKLKFELTDYLNTGSWNRTAILRDVYPSLIFNSNDTKWGGIAYDYTGGMALWVNAPSVDVSAVNPAMYITNSGNVGIGTSSPSFKLHVSGDLGADHTFTLAADNSSNATASRIKMYSHNNFRGAGTFLSGVDATWFMGAPYTDFSGSFIIGRVSEATFSENSSTYSSALFTVKSNGNVGIGVTNPSYKLQVNGSFNATNPMINSASTADNVSAMEWRYGTFDTYRLILKQTVTSGVVRWNFSQINNSTAYDNVLVLDRGAVGIGTTNPNLGLLHVEGTVYSLRFQLAQGADLASGLAGLRVLDNFGGTYQYNNTGPYTGHFTFYHIRNTSSATMFYATSTVFGIGTNAPTARVHIIGGASNWNATTQGQTLGTIHMNPNGNAADWGNAITFGAVDYGGGNTAQAGIYVKASGAYGTKMYFSTTDSFATGSKTRMMIDYNGRVGINSTTPQTNFDVNGTIGVIGTNYIYFGHTVGNINDWGTRMSASGGFHYFNANGFVFNNSGYGNTEFLRITSTGNIGIGTNNPTSKLYVNGDAVIGNSTSQIYLTPDTVYSRGAIMGLGSTISAEGSTRHIRLLTSLNGTDSKISIGYFKAGPGWYAALHIDSSQTNPPLLLQPEGNNVVIGGTIDSGDKLRVYGTVHADQFMSNSQLGLTIDIPTGAGQTLHFEGGILTNVS